MRCRRVLIYHGESTASTRNPRARNRVTPATSPVNCSYHNSADTWPPIANRRPPPTTLVTALSPVLVMLMVGSLVFFLVEVLYAGKYSGRLLYTLFFFVVGRCWSPASPSRPTPARATLYGLLLGVRHLPRASRLRRVPRRRLAQVVRLARQPRPHAAHLVERPQADLGLHPHRREAEGAGRGRALGRGSRRQIRRQETGDQADREADRPHASTNVAERRRRRRRRSRSPTRASGTGSSGTRSTATRSARARTRRACGSSTSRSRPCPLFALGQSLVDPGR